jgi:hypothetical protein
MKSRCGDRPAFDQLELLSVNGDVVCLGYLMLVLHRSDISLVIPNDKARAALMGTEIVAKLKEKSPRGDFDDYGSLNHHEQTILGCLLVDGIGVEKNESVAVSLFAFAANEGNCVAQLVLGWCYEHGTGIAQDKARAVEWYTVSANQ